MGVVKLAFQLILYTAVAAFLLIFIPGIPPDMKFEPYNVTPPSKLEGKLAPNGKLDQAELVVDGEFMGPESVALRGDEVYTGIMGGLIIRLKNDGKWEKIVQTGEKCAGDWEVEVCGRPLGLRFDSSGKLLVADSSKGLLRVDVDKKTVEALIPRFAKIDGSQPLNFADDVDVSSKDGTVYLSDAGLHGTFGDALVDMIGEPTGRLIKYDPKSKKSEVLLSGLRFANGVQLSKNEDFILISETGLGRVLKYNLKGANKGNMEIFIDGLPGFPDNIRSNGKGGFYISLIISRSLENPSQIEKSAHFPWARKLILRLEWILVKICTVINSYAPNEYIGKAIAYIKHQGPFGHITAFPRNVIIVEADEKGNILGSLQAEKGKISYISEIGIGEKYTYLGSPFTKQLWRIKTEYIS